MNKIFFVAVVIVFSTNTAYCSWHGANWGGSPSEFLSKFNLQASKPTAQQLKDDANNIYGEPSFVFSYSFKNYSFDGSVYFKDKKLKMIDLSSNQGGACDSVEDYLNNLYGNANFRRFSTQVGYTSIPTWTDNKNSNIYTVFYIQSISSCDVQITQAKKTHDSM